MTIGPIAPQEETVIETQNGERPVIKVESPQKTFETAKTIIRVRQIIWYVLLIVEILLFIRVVLKLFGAYSLSGFSVLIEILTSLLMFLFNGLFTPTISSSNSSVIEWSTLFAMLIYAVIAWIASRYLKLKKPTDPREAEQNV